MSNKHKNFAKLAWIMVGYTVFVILFGAFVRATGSGAGCGDHWPLCNGVIVPRPHRIETIIEFTHRITSGLLLIGSVIAAVWAFRAFPKRHALRQGTVLSLVFVLLEAAIGAGLVLLQLVEHNATPLRAAVVGLHLFNTFLLLTAMTYVAWYASRGYSEPFRIRVPKQRAWLIISGLVLYGLVGAAGAVTALGDTLFPPEAVASLHSLAAEQQDTSLHFLVKLRVIHPMFAVAVSAFIFWLAGHLRHTGALKAVNRNTYLLQGAVICQLIGGVLNIILMAPVWMQLYHLFFADVILVLFVVVAVESLSYAPLYEKETTLQPATA